VHPAATSYSSVEDLKKECAASGKSAQCCAIPAIGGVPAEARDAREESLTDDFRLVMPSFALMLKRGHWILLEPSTML
jgi:hypothetical protein